MTADSDLKLFICYMPGVDRRRVDAQRTPYLQQLLDTYGACTLQTIPSTELTPTLLTGVEPHKHGIWQVSYREPAPITGLGKLVELLPDVVTTTAQCFGHLINSKRDLAAVPWRRRRQFRLHRMKYTRREHDPTCLDEIGGYSSIIQEIGHERAGYVFGKTFADMEAKLDGFPRPGKVMDFVELYGFDLFSHWNLDHMERIEPKLRLVDDFVRRLHERCRQAGVTMVMLVDHGQEPIKQSINLIKRIKQCGVPRDEFTYFVEVSAVRFWFKTDRAREAITKMLADVSNVTVRTYQQMHEYDICFDSPSHGELYCFANHGFTFFPHDFYNPIANAYLGLTDPLLRPRLFNPRHRGNHGHLPNHPAEDGYVILCDERYRPTMTRGHIRDFAPTVMRLLGRAPAAHMTGRQLFERSA